MQDDNRRMADHRPDPDQLLAQVQAEEARARRGRLRVFFGALAGVGKTYAMLEAALAAKAAGTDVVVGYVEPHGRRETERMLETLESLPLQPVRYRGVVRQEFNLDAALQRHPGILLVDELAHSNLVDGEPPPRHAKRWQDIAELSTPASMSGRRSTSSTWKASTTSLRKSRASASARRSRTTCSTMPTRSS